MEIFSYNSNGMNIHRTISKHPKSESFPMHAHSVLEMLFFISGDCKYLIEGNEYILKPNDVIITRPSETHNLCVLSDHTYERVTIHIPIGKIKPFDPNGSYLKPFLDRPLGTLNHYSREDFDSNLYKLCFEELYTASQLSFELESLPRILTIMSEITKAFYSKQNSPVEHTPAVSTGALQIINYINENLYSHLSLSSLAERFFISQSQLERIFKKSTGSSVWEYITIKRLINARNLIKKGMPTGQACNACGFKDYSSFYRMYVSRFKVSPKKDSLEN